MKFRFAASVNRCSSVFLVPPLSSPLLTSLLPPRLCLHNPKTDTHSQRYHVIQFNLPMTLISFQGRKKKKLLILPTTTRHHWEQFTILVDGKLFCFFVCFFFERRLRKIRGRFSGIYLTHFFNLVSCWHFANPPPAYLSVRLLPYFILAAINPVVIYVNDGVSPKHSEWISILYLPTPCAPVCLGQDK